MTERLSQYASRAWVDVIIDKFLDAAFSVGQVGGCDEVIASVFFQGLAGKGLPLFPDLKLALSGNDQVPLMGMPCDAFIAATYLSLDESMGGADNLSAVTSAYGVFNVSMGFEEHAAVAY